MRVLNGPEGLLAAHDKLQTARALERAGLPHPATRHVTDLSELSALELPLVLKPRFGSWGRDVVLCLDPGRAHGRGDQAAGATVVPYHGSARAGGRAARDA